MADLSLKFDCLYIDFSKAFDKVSISLLLEKCEKYKLGSRTLTWITDYLSGHSQQVIVGSALSSESPILSGVPQGSCLGPVLFCLFVNDLPEVIRHSTVKLFADNIKLYKSVTSPVDFTLIQEDLNALNDWCKLNSMFVNHQKCFVLHYFSKSSTYHYFLGDTPVSSADSVRDLGIQFDNQLKFHKHVSIIL